MTATANPTVPPVHIGEGVKTPDVVQPDPATLFLNRARRFRALADGHPLAGYLTFLAGIAEAQDSVLHDLPPAPPPSPEAVERALSFGMPPLRRAPDAVDDVLLTTLDRLFDALSTLDMPEPAQAALAGVIAADADERRAMIANVQADSLPVEEIAEHVFVAAGVQVHYARLAAALPAGKLANVADGACPACGGPPLASTVAGWRGAQSARFVNCARCATQWHVVRIKCVACGSTAGIHYAHPEGSGDAVKAECCDNCQGYLKILYAVHRPELDAVADDVATAGLDLLLKERGRRRIGFNVYLAGF